MQIGEVIRKYRKQLNLTQEEMAYRLGVTTPAVNKWENGNSYPDIMMLAPIARLLNISLDTLLVFREELTEEKINEIIRKIDERFKQESLEAVFPEVKKLIQTYPNCEKLIWQLAVIVDAQRLVKENVDAKLYDEFLLKCYTRVLESQEEELRTLAADSLFGYYMRMENYEKAEGYLTYYSKQNPERKRKQALIYSKTNRKEEAFKAYEELLFCGYQMLSAVFQSIYTLAVVENDLEKAHKIVEKQEQMAKLFEMGQYYEVSCKLELAIMEKDITTLLDTMEKMLEGVETITSFTKSELYEHMKFKEVRSEFKNTMKENLRDIFQDKETYGFLEGEERWKQIVK